MQNIEIPIIDFLILLLSWSVILFGIVLAFVLFFKQNGRQLSHRILAMLLLVASFFLIDQLVRLTGLANQFNALWVLPIHFQLSIPPLIYCYLKFKLYPELYFKKQDLLHFIIPAVQAVISIFIGCSSLAFKTEIWYNGFLNTLYTIEDVTFAVLATIYGYFSFQLLKEKRRKWSAPLKRWAYQLLRILVAVLTIHVFLMMFYYYRPVVYPLLDYFHYLVLLSFLFFTVWKALDQYFPERIYQLSPLYTASPKTTTPDLDHQWFQSQTKRLFEEEQIFLNPDLNLALLCKAYGISKRSLSEYTQSVLGKNINELINHYRVDYVLKCLAEGQHHRYNILSIGYGAGFASKSTFYRVFKAATGCTPSEYISQLN
ncbi:MAG: helix-turn-helix transcriptional regulator [Bacteroidota bacterium]